MDRVSRVRRAAGVAETEPTRTRHLPPLASLPEDEAIDLLTNTFGVSNETAWLLVGVAHGKIRGDAWEVPDVEVGEP